MTSDPPLPWVPGDAVEIGLAGGLVEDAEGGRVFLHGMLMFAWDAADEAGRRLAAVQLVATKAARVMDVAAAFGVDRDTIARWGRAFRAGGVAGVVPGRTGPKGPSKLTEPVVAEVRARREAGASMQAIAAAVGISIGSVHRVLQQTEDTAANTGTATNIPEPVAETVIDDEGRPAPVPVPVLPAPVARGRERALARRGLLVEALPVFHPAGRVGLAGLFLALPGLEASGLLACAHQVFGDQGLPGGFYGLDSLLVEGALRCLVGEPRAEGATRIDPHALGRVLGLDRAPEVKTIRRRIGQLAGQGKATELLAGMARHHVARHDDDAEAAGLVLYVDGHVRSYQGTRRVAKTHAPRLRFPAPATVETWISDAQGDPVLVVMAEPAASLASELRRLVPTLRQAVGDDRRVLVGFDRGGWSPALFHHLHDHGFDTLTWRKQPCPDLDPALFSEIRFTDPDGRIHTWQGADTTVTIPLDDGATFAMRQVTRLLTGKGGDRQAHVLTTRTDLSAGEVWFRMGSRWRLENYFRYARMHFALDAHDSYAATEDDPGRMVPNPAKKASRDTVNAARARLDRVRAATDAALLDWNTPPPGKAVSLTNADHNRITAPLWEAEEALEQARQDHAATPSRLPLGQVSPGQQVLDIETKLLTHAIRIAAYNTITALVRDLRVHTGYARAADEAHTLIRQALTATGDIIPGDDTLTIRLDPLPTRRATTALAKLCEHLTATQTRYPATNLTLHYETKPRL